MLISRTLHYLCLLSISLPGYASAFPKSDSFLSQCPTLLQHADSVAEECPRKAKAFTRYFSGRPEVHSAYFKLIDAGSHFQVGCTLNALGRIATLGVYYSTDPDFDFETTKKGISSIDFDGDVELLDSGTGERTHMILVREFVTSVTRPERYFSGRIKNCEPASDRDGLIHWVNGSFNAEFRATPSGAIVQAVELGTNCSAPSPYVRQLSGHSFEPIWTDLACGTFIMDDGSLLTAASSYEKFCVSHSWKIGLAADVCPHHE